MKIKEKVNIEINSNSFKANLTDRRLETFNPKLYGDIDGLINYFTYIMRKTYSINQAYLSQIPYKISALKWLKNSYLAQIKITEKIYNSLINCKDYKDYLALRDKFSQFEEDFKRYKNRVNSISQDSDLKELKDFGLISDIKYKTIKLKLRNMALNLDFEQEFYNLKKQFENHKYKPEIIKTKKGYQFVKINAEYTFYENRILALKDNIKLINYKIKKYRKDLNRKNNYINPSINSYDIYLLRNYKISDNIKRFLKFRIKKDNKVSNRIINTKNSNEFKQLCRNYLSENLAFNMNNLIADDVNKFIDKFHNRIL